MPNNSLYDGIIAPQGGMYKPGPPVMLPSSGNFSDLVGNGGGLSALPSAPPTAPHLGTQQSTIDAANPMNIDRLGLTNDPFQTQTPATQAIAAALLSGSNGGAGSGAWGPSWDLGINPDLQWQATTQSPGSTMGGDSWGRSRINGQASMPNRPGMVTGPRPVGMGLAALPAPHQAAPVLQGNATSQFLTDRGVSTAGQTIGQQANDLNKQLAGGSRNEDGSRSFM